MHQHTTPMELQETELDFAGGVEGQDGSDLLFKAKAPKRIVFEPDGSLFKEGEGGNGIK